MPRLSLPIHGYGAPLPGGLTRIARPLLVAILFLFVLSAPAPLEAQKDTEQTRASGARTEAGTATAGRCPNISLCCHGSVKQGLLGPFVATLDGGTPGVKPSFNWKLSAGSVAAGSGTKEILIDTKGLKGGTILATVEVGGYGPRCSVTCLAEAPGVPGEMRSTRLATLSVSVKNSLDGRPVPRAKINVYRDGGAVGGQAETNARGEFARGGWTPGVYRVEVSADRFERQVSNVTLDALSAGAVALSLKPTAPPTTPSPTPSPEPSPSPTPTPTPSPSPTATPTHDSAVTITTPTPMPTPTPAPRWEILIANVTEEPGVPLLLLAALAALVAVGYAVSSKMAAGAVAGAAGEAAAAPAEQALGAAAGTTKQADEVHCTVYAPPEARPGDMLKVQVFAHLEEQHKLLAALAAERDEEAREGGSEALKGKIERGKELTFTLDMPGLKVKEAERSLVWNGEPDCVRFTVTVPDECKPKVIWGTVEILYESVPVGEVEFKFKVVTETAQVAPAVAAPAVAAPPPEQREVMFTKAFISYSRKDSELVLEKVQMLEAQGIECYLDMMTFRSGEDWKQMINHYIDVCDVFFLFWSNASKASPEVDKEIRYALQRREKAAPRPVIKPIPIEGPPVVPPPPYLSHLHFDDRYRYFIKAKQVERLEASARPPAPPAAT